MPGPVPIHRQLDGRWQVAPSVTGVAIDSRTVSPGNIFVAVPGGTTDGHTYIRDAIRRGARAVVVEHRVGALTVPTVVVPSARRAAAELSAAVYGHPARRLHVVGVTGTNGKTSVVYWLRALLERAGHRTGMLSSVLNWTGRDGRPAWLTTPEAPDIQRALREMCDHGLTHAVLEVSSHGLVQHRVDEIPFRSALLTNITREHLDFHGTMAHYVDAKARLFTELLEPDGTAVFNGDDPHSEEIARRWTGQTVTFGVVRGDVRAVIVQEDPWATALRVVVGQQSWDVVLPMPGRYNIYNLLAVLAALVAEHIDLDRIMPYVDRLPVVPGRLEVAAHGDGVTVVVDYAHTPDGLMQVLHAVRRLVAPGASVWLVFGARGGRDRGKRPIMGQIAARLADRVILTTDSPYDEPEEQIVRELALGFAAVGTLPFAVETDRRLAIWRAVTEAGTGDVVLITGRGPEPLQYIGRRQVPLLDREAAEQAMTARLEGRGEMGQNHGGGTYDAARDRHHSHLQ